MDMIVFPECCFGNASVDTWVSIGMTIDSEPIRLVRDKCRQLGLWGVFSPWLLSEAGNSVGNTAIVINDAGEIVLQYQKMNPACPFECTDPGHRMEVCDGPKGARLAVLICSDILYPETWREAAFKGANVFLHIAHWTAPNEEWLRLCDRAAALLNSTFVVSVNMVGSTPAYSVAGYSCAVDPMARVLAEAPKGIPWMMYVSFNPSEVDSLRNQAQINGESFLWSADHRGASAPGQKGKGLGFADYTAYQRR